MRDKDCYPDTNILINKLDIRNQEQLDQFESAMFDLALIQLQEETFTINSIFDIFKIHKILFEEVYSWAGKQRKVNIYKEELVLSGRSVQYESHSEIKKSIDLIEEKFKALDWEHRNIIDDIIFLIAKIWKVHPFREGNTRAILTFLYLLLKQNNFELNTKLIGDNAKYFRNALVMASLDEYSEYQYLETILKDALSTNKTILIKNKYETINDIEMGKYKYNYHTIK